MKYYLVALFDDESYKVLNPLQRNLSKKFKANRNSPVPYIALEAIENPNTDKLNLVVDKIIKPFKYFKVGVFKKATILDSNKTLNLKIDNSGYIKRLNRVMSDTLKLHGFNILSPSNDELVLTLANMNYPVNDAKKANFDIDSKYNLSTLKVNRIELWKVSNRRETLIQSYPLKAL